MRACLQGKWPMRLLIRLFTEVADDAAAQAVDARMEDALRGAMAADVPRGLFAAHAPVRYRKEIPRLAQPLFEHGWWLAPATLDDVRGLMAVATEGWFPPRVEDALLQAEEDEDGSWVWNRSESGRWLLPEVAWVELAYQHDG
jgi:hypothetical protein